MPNCLTLKKSNCKNCYKCIRHCPVKAIRFSGNQAHIIGNECILCGQCFVVCPQNAKQIVDETENVVNEVEAGNITLVYANADTDKGYLTYIVSYINDEEMTVHNVEMDMIVARFQRNIETGSWSNIEMAEFNDETIFNVK